MNTKETQLYDLIKNKICDYEISRTDTKSSKKQLREYLDLIGGNLTRFKEEE